MYKIKEIESKQCLRCGQVKNKKEFHMTKSYYGKIEYRYFHAKCKDCRNLERREYNKKNRNRISNYNKDYYINNKDELKKRYRERYYKLKGTSFV